MTGCLFMEFDDNGINCEQCKLKTNNRNYNYCIALGDESQCSENWRRKDCPLVGIDNKDLIDVNDELYKEIMRHGESIVYSCNKTGYKNMLQDKEEKELEETIKKIKVRMDEIQSVFEKLLQKKEACEELLDIKQNKI